MSEHTRRRIVVQLRLLLAVSIALVATPWLAACSSQHYSKEVYEAVAVAADGTVYLAGEATLDWERRGPLVWLGVEEGDDYYHDAIIVRCTSALEEPEYASYRDGYSCSFKAVAVAPDGTVYAAGYITQIYNDEHARANLIQDDALIVRYSSTLELLGVATFDGGGKDCFEAIAVAPDGTVYAAGRAERRVAIEPDDTIGDTLWLDDGLIVSYSPELVEQQTVQLESPWSGSFNCIAVSADGSVYAAGMDCVPNEGQSAGGSVYCWVAVVCRYSGSLALEAVTHPLGDEDDSNLYALAIAVDGSVYAAGYKRTWRYSASEGRDTSIQDAAIVRCSGDLGEVQTKMWINNSSNFTGLALTADGMLIAVGEAYVPESQALGASSSDGPRAVAVQFTPDFTVDINTLAKGRDHRFIAAATAPDGTVLVAGYVDRWFRRTSMGKDSSKPIHDGLVVRYSTGLVFEQSASFKQVE